MRLIVIGFDGCGGGVPGLWPEQRRVKDAEVLQCYPVIPDESLGDDADCRFGGVPERVEVLRGDEAILFEDRDEAGELE